MKMFFIVTLLSLSALAQSPVNFRKQKLVLGTQTLEVEIAETEEQLQRGLMYRTGLPEGTGMLFIFKNEAVRAFWMKNTFIPLSIGYFNAKKELIDIQDMEPTKSEMQEFHPSYPSKGPAQFALEVPKGWFAKHKIKLKQKFELR